MAKFKLEWKHRLDPSKNIPALKFDRPFWEDIGHLCAFSILENVVSQKQASGRALKRNASSTQHRKQRENKPLKSLVDEHHRFVRGGDASWGIQRFHVRNSGVTVGATNQELEDLIGYVGDKGYTGYIGFSKKLLERINARLKTHLKGWVKEWARKSR